MKAKNVKVRAKDVKAGVTAYVAHPVYGIDKVIFKAKPKINKHTNSLFVEAMSGNAAGRYMFERDRSLCDMGITAQYNGRRTFFKLKHAEAWVKKWGTDLRFQKDQAEHEERCKLLDYDYYTEDDQDYWEQQEIEDYQDYQE